MKKFIKSYEKKLSKKTKKKLFKYTKNHQNAISYYY